MYLPGRVLRQFGEVQVTPVVTAYFAHVSRETALEDRHGERVRGGEEGGAEGDGVVEGEDEVGDEGVDEDVDIGGDTKSISSGDSDDSLKSSSNKDGDDDDMPELEDIPTIEGGGG
ncbi:uncharacterized protein LOC131066604 [Cryptomeria japonica]|uniref:uncharacterized protein LOC131066604 n=1 Tax=Cryptomeria japonica TaxID=3369 RepID=UPI0025AC5903|nr:uncharacterized protein LOC131066604 [Cryptomeria japonica]